MEVRLSVSVHATKVTTAVTIILFVRVILSSYHRSSIALPYMSHASKVC